VIEEIRIRSLGVIEESVLELGPGLNVVTGETGAGKTMLVTALGLLLGARADAGAVRAGAPSARVDGLVRVGAQTAAEAEQLGADVEDDTLLIADSSRPAAGPAPSSVAQRSR
jgi:DNA repair protein RecN (Recombination protein N)